MLNSMCYVMTAALLEAGSIAFYPGLVDNTECNGYAPCPIGQYLYIGATCLVGFALLWVRSYFHLVLFWCISFLC